MTIALLTHVICNGRFELNIDPSPPRSCMTDGYWWQGNILSHNQAYLVLLGESLTFTYLIPCMVVSWANSDQLVAVSFLSRLFLEAEISESTDRLLKRHVHDMSALPIASSGWSSELPFMSWKFSTGVWKVAIQMFLELMIANLLKKRNFFLFIHRTGCFLRLMWLEQLLW